MPTTQPMNPALYGANHRSAPHLRESAWKRPQRAKATSAEQPVSPALADVTMRDTDWRLGDRRDLYALAAVALSFGLLALGLAVLVN